MLQRLGVILSSLNPRKFENVYNKQMKLLAMMAAMAV